MRSGHTNIRLKCLECAVQRQGAYDPRNVLDIAEDYYNWVTKLDPDTNGENGSDAAPNQASAGLTETQPGDKSSGTSSQAAKKGAPAARS